MPLTGMLPAFFGSVGLYLRTQSDGVMTADEASGYIDQVGTYARSEGGSSGAGLPSPTGLYIAGARPLSRPADLELMLDRAAKYGMPVEVVTRTYRVDSADAAERALRRLSSRLHLLTVTTSRSDLDSYGIASFEQLLEAVRRIDLSVQVLVTVGPDEPFPMELLSLEVLNCDSSVLRISGTGVSDADGASPLAWPDGHLLAAPPRYARCAELLGLAIVAGGDVYPCAASIGFAALRLGNVNVQNIGEIVRRALADPALIRLRNEGPHHLFEQFRTRLPVAASSGYASSCDFHRQFMAWQNAQRPAAQRPAASVIAD